MSEALDKQISVLSFLLAERVLSAEDAAVVAGARASLEYLRKHEIGIRAYIADLEAVKKTPMVQEALREFPDAEIIGVRKTG